MLKFLGASRIDHPLADAERLAALVKSLPADPTKAIDELATQLDVARTHEALSFAQRAEAIEALDAGAQVHARRLAREYLAARGNKFQAQRLLGSLRVYWLQAAEGLSLPALAIARGEKGADAAKRHLPILIPRALRAWAQVCKWQQQGYTPLDADSWSRALTVYALAERLQLATRAVQPYARVQAETTAQREFLHLALFAASSPDSLDPRAMEVLDRVIGHFVQAFDVLGAAQPGAHYSVDLAGNVAPARTGALPQPRASLRYLSGARALAPIEALRGEVLVANAPPEALGLDGVCDAAELVRILDLLASHWGAQPPTRRSQRRKMNVRLTVGWGFDGLIDVLVSLPSVGTMLDFSSSSPVESWTTEDVSLHGFAAVAPRMNDDKLMIGALLAIQGEGAADWQAGVIRRLAIRPDGSVFVAVETLARAPIPTEVYVDAGGALSKVPEVAILLATPGTVPEMGVLVRAGVSGPGQVYVFDHEGARFALTPVQLVARGTDYEHIRCTVTARGAALDLNVDD